jgi:organic hydroperoxide reductase OsmC/OhrA
MTTIRATVSNGEGQHTVWLGTNDRTHTLSIAPGASGFGSSANGGELLFLALATCYCNDIYREAARQNIPVRRVEVTVDGTFDAAPGSAARDVRYSARVEAEASAAQIEALMRHTDTVAEIHNTLRQGAAVSLASVEAIPV